MAQMLFFLLHHIIIKQAKEVLSLIIKLFTMQPISLSSSIMFHQEQVLIFFRKLQRKSQSFQELTESKRQAEILDQIAEINELCGDELNIWSGNDDQIVDVLERGGKGVISVLSNVCPQETHDIVAKYLDGDTEGSKALMDKYMKLAKTLFCDVNPIPVKEAVNMLGFNAGHCRLPLIDMTDENKALMKTVLEEYKLIK